MKISIISNSPEHTTSLGRIFAQNIKEMPLIIALSGDLGSGKTTFVRGVTQKLSDISFMGSPTFAITNDYGTFLHIDLFRIDDVKELESAGLMDIFLEPDSPVFVEWAEKFSEILIFDITVEFEVIDENKRKIQLTTSDKGLFHILQNIKEEFLNIKSDA